MFNRYYLDVFLASLFSCLLVCQGLISNRACRNMMLAVVVAFLRDCRAAEGLCNYDILIQRDLF